VVVKCASCGVDLAADVDRTRKGFICASIMGDEHIETYFFCEACGVYTVEDYHDRFMGDDEVSTSGPVSKDKGDRKLAIIARCPDPANKRCRCEAHREYFGSWLD